MSVISQALGSKKAALPGAKGAHSSLSLRTDHQGFSLQNALSAHSTEKENAEM